MFRQLLRHLQGELYRILKTYDKLLPEDGTIMDETYSRVLIIIHVFYVICAFCSCIKDIITVRKINGMESFKTMLISFKSVFLSLRVYGNANFCFFSE